MMAATSTSDLLSPSALDTPISLSDKSTLATRPGPFSGRMLGSDPTNSSPLEQNRDLTPGIYKIENALIPDCVIDLSGADGKTVIGFPAHGWENQQWEVSRLGAGYSIRSVHNGNYITIELGLADGKTVVASPFPVSWVFEADDCEEDVWKIGWPTRNNPLFFDMDKNGSRHIQLRGDESLSGSRTTLWRLVKLRPIGDGSNQTSLENLTPQDLTVEPPASMTTADTIIDADGLKLGGNGELAITTTTTTVTTTVTKVKRVPG